MRTLTFVFFVIIPLFIYAQIEGWSTRLESRMSERVEINGICYRFLDDNYSESYALVSNFDSPEESFEKYQGVVSIPASVTFNDTEYPVWSVYIKAFENCEKLTEVVLSEGMSMLHYRSFANCGEIKINFPQSIEDIGVYAFQNTIITNSPDFSHIPFIGGSICAALPEMSTVYISAKNERLLDSFFAESNIEKIIFEETDYTLENTLHLYPYVFSHTKLKEVRLPSRPMMLYLEMFYNDDSIERIVFTDLEGRTMKTSPSYEHPLKYNKDQLIENCPNLKEVVCLSPNPPEFASDMWGDFNPIYNVHIMDDYSHTVLKVPAGSEKLYADHPVWGRFIHIADLDGNFYKTTMSEFVTTTPAVPLRIVSDGSSPLNIPVDAPASVTIFNMAGAEIWHGNANDGILCPTLPAGIYIVRRSNP